MIIQSRELRTVIKMKIAVCDDERAFAQNLKNLIDDYYNSPDYAVYIFTSANELLSKFKQNPDLFSAVFLDIEMPELDGIQTAARMREISSDINIIFLTSHTELAMEGYEVNALRFLAKPVNQAKLYGVLALLDKSVRDGKCIVIADGGSRILVKQSDVLYIKAENVYLQIVTENKNYLLRKKLTDMEAELDSVRFVRIHRSYIVGLAHVKSYDGKSVIMTNGDPLPLSRSCEKQFKDAVMNYLRRFH